MLGIYDYINLITSQYQGSPKFKSWLSVLLQPFIDIQACAETMYQHFNINTAVGNQLDILGSYLQVSRVLPFIPSDGSSGILNDNDFRFLIKSEIMRSYWDGTIENIQYRWRQIFSNIYLSIIDNQDMSMNFLIIGPISNLQQQMINNNMIIPKPMGVRINYTFTNPPIFSIDQDGGYFRGFDTGSWLTLA